MANEDQYINPIIQAMIHTSQTQQSAKELAEKTRQAKAEEGFRQSQLQQQESQFEKEHELNKRHLEMYHDQLQSVLEDQQIGRLKALQGIQQTGGDVGGMFGGQSAGGEAPNKSYQSPIDIPTILNPNAGSGKVNIPGVGNVNPNVFGSPSQQNQIIYDQSRAQAAGVGSVTGPEKERHDTAEFERAMFIHKYDNDTREKDTRLKGAFDIEVAKIHAAAARSALMTQTDPDAVAQAYKGVLGGQTSFSALPKEVKAGVLNLAGQRGTNLPTNQKQQNDYLDNIGRMEEMMGMYKDLALNFSRDAKDSSIVYTVGGSHVPFTELKSKINAAETLGGSLASFFDKQNRKSDQEIKRQVTGLFDPRSSTKDNLDKINQHIKIINQNLKGIFSGINPEDVKVILQDRGIKDILPEESSSEAPNSPQSGRQYYRNSIGHRVYTEDNGKTFKDATTNQPVNQ